MVVITATHNFFPLCGESPKFHLVPPPSHSDDQGVFGIRISPKLRKTYDVGVLWVGGGVGGSTDEDNIPRERVVCHPPARARRGTKTWNMNFWPLTLRRRMVTMTTMKAGDNHWKGDFVTKTMLVDTF